MKSANDDPGSISTKELAEYWRMPSVRAAREVVLSRFSSGLFRAMFAMKEIKNGKEIHRRFSA